MKVLLIEDEKKVSSFIKKGLENERYIVETAFDGKSDLDKAFDSSNDIIILDLMLPVMDGLTLLNKLREKNIHTPVLILTAKEEIEDRVHGLNLGADDYLVKPFFFNELLARLRALLRRSNQNSSSIVEFGDLQINLLNHKVTRGGILIQLTAKEYALLEFFVHNVNRALNRITIAEHVWEYDFDRETNFIDVHINRLRTKLGDNKENKLIQTVRGYGYIFKPE